MKRPSFLWSTGLTVLGLLVLAVPSSATNLSAGDAHPLGPEQSFVPGGGAVQRPVYHALVAQSREKGRIAKQCPPNCPPPPPDNTDLPGARGLRLGQVRIIVDRLAKSQGVPFPTEQFAALVDQLMQPLDCADYGAMCALIPKDRVPYVIGEAWKAGLRDANPQTMFAALNKAMQNEFSQQVARSAPDLVRLEARLQQAINTGQVNPQNQPAVFNWLISNTSNSWYKKILEFLPDLDWGTNVKCITETKGIGLALRRLVVCSGALWGTTAAVFAGKTVKPNQLGAASISLHFRGLGCGGCIPWNADYIRTQIKYGSYTEVSNACPDAGVKCYNKAFHVIASDVWWKKQGSQQCEAQGQSRDGSVQIGPIKTSMNCGY